ncbi:female pronucleus assembly [Rhizoctonia solani]|uniref:Female pronucleus assembly n=1 Tax=Rhizoctonia solani TaxID=456999 RepID=A0A8H7I1D0_9AGAM|nr:female pronucleus assembly [Rhizoctonia solani]
MTSSLFRQVSRIHSKNNRINHEFDYHVSQLGDARWTEKACSSPDERNVSTVPNAQLTVHIPNSSDNGTNLIQTITASGDVWLTSDRFVFVAAPESQSTSLGLFALVSQVISSAPANETSGTKLETLSLPWLSVLSTSFAQPYFGANYLAMDVRPAEGGGLVLGTKVEVRLTDRGMFEFINMVEGIRNKAIERAREARLGEPLPIYNQPQPSVAPPTDDLPPGYTA